MNNIITGIVNVVGAIAILAGISLILAFPIKWCWNYSVAEIWNLPLITWGQAWCLVFLGSAFFKSNTIVNK